EVGNELRRVLGELDLKRVPEDDVDVVREPRQRWLQRAVDLDRMNAADAIGEVAREHALAGADLEHDVVRPQLRQPVEHPEDVRVAQEVLAVLFLRPRAHGSEKHSAAFRSTCCSSSAGSSARAWASAARVWTTLAGSFRFPRTGCGARYGESVSARMRSAGTWVAARRRSTAFGKVALPANEMYQSRSSAVGSMCGDEKQWRTTVPAKSTSAPRVSSSAARVWITTGFPSSAASPS